MSPARQQRQQRQHSLHRHGVSSVIIADVAADTQCEEAYTAALVVRVVMTMMSIMMMMVMLFLLHNHDLWLRGLLLVIYWLWLLIGSRCGGKGLVVVPLGLLSAIGVGVFLSRIHFCLAVYN